MMDSKPALARTAIHIAGVSKRFSTRDGIVEALGGVDLTIAEQEFVSVLGPSGCGKTTLLKMIAGLERPTTGQLSIFGRDVKGPQKTTGIVFQTPALMRWRTVLENVLLPVEIIGGVGAETVARAKSLLQLVGILDFSSRYPHELSGGMQQRVAIARALMHDPNLLLLDEPFSALDTMTRSQLNVELLRIWSQTRKTSVLITHSIAEAVFLSDRVVVMTPRPARVSEIVVIPLPRPRTPAMRLSPEFIGLVDHIGQIFGLEYV